MLCYVLTKIAGRAYYPKETNMATELLRDYDFDGKSQNCIKLECGCGSEKIFPFERIRNRERMTCPHCGCVSSFSAVWIEKIEKEFDS